MTNLESPSPTLLVEGYHRAISTRLADVDAAIHDLRYQIQGGQIIHAADFTEIEAFVLPDQQESSIPPTSEDEKKEQIALEIATLNSIFFGRQGGPAPAVVLLPPHRLELRNAESYFQTEAFGRFRELASKAEDELYKLHLDETFNALFADLEKATIPLEKARAEEHIFSYINKNASNFLLAVTNERGASAPARLRDLLENAHIVDISSNEVVGRVIDPSELDQNIVTKIQSKVTEARSSAPIENESRRRVSRTHNVEHRSRRDALAIAFVLHINDLLGSLTESRKNHRVVLVTRSGALIRAVQRHSQEAQIPRLANFIRRPSAFSPALLQPTLNSEEQLTNLTQRRLSLQLALKGMAPDYHGLPSTVASTVDKDQQMAALIERLQTAWRESNNITIATSDWRVDPSRTASDLTKVLSVLRDRRQLHELMARSAIRLAAEIDLANSLLGHFEPRSEVSTISSARLEPSRRRWRAQRPAFVWSKETHSTLGLYFYHPLVTNLRRSRSDGVKILRELVQTKMSRNIGTIFELPDEDDNEDRRPSEQNLVELCLASSFLEAISDRWEAAELYSELATQWSSRLDATPRHEAHYMRAVCRRRAHDPTESALRMCLQDLDKAQVELQAHSNEGDDPRYIFERGVAYFGLWEHVDLGNGGAGVEANESERTSLMNDSYRKAVQLFDRAATILRERQMMLKSPQSSLTRQFLDVANARCYARIAASRTDDETFRMMIELRKAILACGWKEDNVPIAKLDTLVWAMFHLRRRLPDPAWLPSAAAQLAKRVETDKRPPKDRSLIIGHLIRIEGELNLGLRILTDAT